MPAVPCMLPPQAGDAAPDVWLQLLEHCANIKSCQPTIMLNLVEQQQLVARLQLLSSNMQQQVDTLQVQCCRQQQQMLQQQEQMLRQQQVIDQLQEANTQQQQEVNQLQQHVADAVEQRVVALEAQLAQVLQTLQRRA